MIGLTKKTKQTKTQQQQQQHTHTHTVGVLNGHVTAKNDDHSNL